MSQQCFAFDTPAKISRRSDPITSQQSAAETEPKLNGLQQLVLKTIQCASKPLTSNEAAKATSALYIYATVETFRKRVRELARAKHIEEAGERRCEVTGKSAMTFRVKEQQSCREN